MSFPQLMHVFLLKKKKKKRTTNAFNVNGMQRPEGSSVVCAPFAYATVSKAALFFDLKF